MSFTPHLTRRQFIQAAGICAAAAATLPTFGAEPTPYQIGCYTRCFDQFDYKTALDGIAQAGFAYAGIMTAKGKNWVMITPDTPVEEAAEIGSQVVKRGLKAVSVYADFAKEAGVSAEQGVKALTRLLENCKACGSPNLLLGGTNDEKVFENYYKAVTECCPAARQSGITVSVKPHGGQNSTGPQCRKIIERVNHPSFRLWYDPGNIFYYSDGKLDPVDDSATVDGLVTGISVKDFMPPKEVLVTPGTGKVDFAKVLQRLRKGGFKSGPLVVECVKRGTMEEVIAEARKARELMEKLTAAL